MPVSDTRINGYQKALREVATTADRFATDHDATTSLGQLLQDGDAAGVTRTLARLGVTNVAYTGRTKRPPLDEDPAPTEFEVFRILPGADNRFPIDIHVEIHISVGC